jgi:hypothetical protein
MQVISSQNESFLHHRFHDDTEEKWCPDSTRSSNTLDNRIANGNDAFLVPLSIYSLKKTSACRNQVAKAVGSGPSYSRRNWLVLSFARPTTKFESFRSSLTCALVLIL